MQVNSSTSPNFGALRIKKTSTTEKALRSLSPERLNEIKKIGEELKDTQFFDIWITSNSKNDIWNCLKYKITSNKNFKLRSFGDGKKELYACADDCYKLNAKYQISRENNNDYGEPYYEFNVRKLDNLSKTLGTYGDDLKELSNVALEMDYIATKIAQEDAIAKTQAEIKQKEVENLTNELFDSFGI